jgi:hypothetical protein
MRTQLVRLAFRRRERERAANGVDERRLPTDDVLPGRRQGVLEVGHEAAGARVEGVDDHLRLGWAGDLDPPVEQVRRRRRNLPRRIEPDRGSFLE